jgi:hypothetical protein
MMARPVSALRVTKNYSETSRVSVPVNGGVDLERNLQIDWIAPSIDKTRTGRLDHPEPLENDKAILENLEIS